MLSSALFLYFRSSNKSLQSSPRYIVRFVSFTFLNIPCNILLNDVILSFFMSVSGRGSERKRTSACGLGEFWIYPLSGGAQHNKNKYSKEMATRSIKDALLIP